MRSLAEIMGNRSPLEWLRSEAERIATRLRSEGWTEDERGLWREGGKGLGLHLLDAHAVASGREGGVSERTAGTRA